MTTLLILRQSLGVPGRQGDLLFANLLQSTRGSAPITNQQELTSAFAGLRASGTPSLLVTSEQSVWKRNRAQKIASRVAAVYPSDQTAGLDFPLVVTTKDATKRKVADRFMKELSSAATRTELHRIGLRTPAGVASKEMPAVGLRASAPKLVPVARRGAAIQMQQFWARVSRGIRVLVLVDVSGSMLQRVPGTKDTRMERLSQSLGRGMALVPDNAEFGLWEFATDLDRGRPYKPLVGLGPMSTITPQGVTRRAQLQATRLVPRPNGDTGMYDSVRAAYGEMKKGYQDDKANVVLVLTDGRNDYADGISLNTVVRSLSRQYDPKRPINVVAMGFGKDIDLAALRKLAGATDGLAVRVNDFAAVMQVFMRSNALLACKEGERCG
jgi:Ca-activated chloride channel family protein